MGSSKTIVKGVRANKSFFEKCDIVAKKHGITRNELIICVLDSYNESYLRINNKKMEQDK